MDPFIAKSPPERLKIRTKRAYTSTRFCRHFPHSSYALPWSGL